MRRFPPAICAILLCVSYPAAARDGFYLGGHYYRAMPERRAPATTPDPIIPLPVPRPRFDTDARPRSAEQTKSAVASKDTKRNEVKPVETPTPTAPALTVPVGTPSLPARDESPAPGIPLPPPKPADIATPVPTPQTPAVAPSGANTTFVPRSLDADLACPGRLTARGVVAEAADIGHQPDERCTVVQAVRLTSLGLRDGGRVEFPDRPVIACTTADVFSLYVRDLLSPLARGSYATPVSEVWTGPGLECRSRDHVFGAKLSAHGQGLAIDIAQLKLGDGRIVAVGDPKTEIDTAFESAARASACGYFHTVLGPGSDAYHRTHWHFDLEVRGAKGDSKFCQ